MLESCRWRGYVPAGGTYALGSLFTPRSCLAAVAESESVKQELHTTHYTTAPGASQRPVLTHHTTLRQINLISQIKSYINDLQVQVRSRVVCLNSMSTQNVPLDSVLCDSSQQVWYLKVWVCRRRFSVVEVVGVQTTHQKDSLAEAERALSDKTNRHHMYQQVDITCFNKYTSHVSISRHHVSTSRHHMGQQHSVGQYRYIVDL